MSSSALPPPLKAAAASLNSLAAPPTKLFAVVEIVVETVVATVVDMEVKEVITVEREPLE